MRSITTPVEDVVAALGQDGYAVVEGLLPAPELAAGAPGHAARAGGDTGRSQPLRGRAHQTRVRPVRQDSAFDGPATHPLVLGVLDRVLGHCQLSAPTGIEIGPGEVARSCITTTPSTPAPSP